MSAEEFKVDFSLDWPEYEARIKEYFKQCIKDKRVIPLPLEADARPAIMLMDALHCELCGADCCRCPGTLKPGRAFIAVSETEKRSMLQAGVPKTAIKTSANNGSAYSYMAYPCPLLKDNRCSVYDVRPIACQRYPIQINFSPDGNLPTLALDSGCPQAPGVAMGVYRDLYQAKKSGRLQ